MNNLHSDTDSATFNNLLFALLSRTEGDFTYAYADAKRIPSIGIGVNLRTYLTNVEGMLNLTEINSSLDLNGATVNQLETEGVPSWMFDDSSIYSNGSIDITSLSAAISDEDSYISASVGWVSVALPITRPAIH